MRFLAAILLTGVVALVPAHADPITACRAAHANDPAAHIACLEDALRAVGAAPATARTPAPVSSAVAAPAQVAPVAAAPVTAGAAIATATAATAPQPTGLGAEQAKARQRPSDALPEQVDVRIVSARYDAAGLGVFTMADGQVWRETVETPARHHLDPGREYAARIERGSIGGYRMYVDGVKWMHKVERLK
jgi:hypothetical protein